MNEPSVSMCMITEQRPEFMEWVAFLFNRLDWPRKELVVVGSTRDRESMELLHSLVDPKAGRLITDSTLSPNLRLGTKRNRCLELANCEWITWADDDDWYPANRFRETWDMMRLYKWPKGIKVLAVQAQQPVLNLVNMRVTHRQKKWIWLHCWYEAKLAKATPFLDLNVGEDGFWIDKLVEDAGGEDADPPVLIQNYFPHQMLCLHHGNNISGHRNHDAQFWPDDFPDWLDSDTVEQISNLRKRLKIGEEQ